MVRYDGCSTPTKYRGNLMLRQIADKVDVQQLRQIASGRPITNSHRANTDKMHIGQETGNVRQERVIHLVRIECADIANSRLWNASQQRMLRASFKRTTEERGVCYVRQQVEMRIY